MLRIKYIKISLKSWYKIFYKEIKFFYKDKTSVKILQKNIKIYKDLQLFKTINKFELWSPLNKKYI